MLFKDLCLVFDKLESVASRLEMRTILAQLYKKLSPEEAAMVSYFIQGRLLPSFIPVEFNLSDRGLKTVAGQAFKVKAGKVNELLRKTGDLGEVWKELANGKSKSALTIKVAYQDLWQLAGQMGTGSVQRKYDLLTDWSQKYSAEELKYLIRIILSKIRLGVSDKSVLDALSEMKAGDLSLRDEVESALGRCSDLGLVAQVLKKSGVKGLEKIPIQPGIPIAPKLVERENTLEKILERVPKPIVQSKYDGLRCQVHIVDSRGGVKDREGRVWTKSYQEFMKKNEDKQNGLNYSARAKSKAKIKVELFSRNLESLTDMFPELVEAFIKLAEKKKIKSAILDSEVVGYTVDTGEFARFQDTMKRRRKYDVDKAVADIPIKAFIFDALYSNGRNLLKVEIEKRLDITENLLKKEAKTSVIGLSPTYYPKNTKELEKIFLNDITAGLEGIIVKEPGSFYEPGTRNFTWIKYKKAMKKELADTIDVVILGYYAGSGRLSKFGIGALLAGVYDRNQDRFETVSKIGTGITDQLWQEIKEKADSYKVDKKMARVTVPKGLRPDVWLEPGLVIEVEADEVTKSPLHSSGYALRFPRFKRFRKKSPEDCTTVKELREMGGNKN